MLYETWEVYSFCIYPIYKFIIEGVEESDTFVTSLLDLTQPATMVPCSETKVHTMVSEGGEACSVLNWQQLGDRK